MKAIILGIMMTLVSMTALAQDNGLITKASKFGFQETQARLETAIKGKGLTIFAKVNHGEGAAQAGLKMPPAILTIFGSPKGGTPFMLAAPTAGIDLPLKALVWADANGKVHVSYNTMDYVKERHDIAGLDELTKKLDGVLANIVGTATE